LQNQKLFALTGVTNIDKRSIVHIKQTKNQHKMKKLLGLLLIISSIITGCEKDWKLQIPKT